MDVLSKEKLEQLAGFQGTNCVSIYIPTHKRGKEVNEQKDAKLLKNHFQAIKNQIKDTKNIAEQTVVNYLKPLLDLIEDAEFWRHQSQGLAVFLGENFFEHYKLPYNVDEYSMLGNGFHLDQLLPAYQQYDDRYYILALSLGKVRLFEAAPHNIEEIDLPERVPQGTNDALSYYDFEKSLQHHSSSPSGGSQNPIYHGQGGEGGFNEAYVKEYFRHLDDALQPIIKDKSRPVVLASVDYLHPIFKETNKSFNLHKDGLTGNFDRVGVHEIHKESLEIMRPQNESLREKSHEKYQEMAGTGMASYQIDDIAPAALNGRIDTLFVVKGTHKWGVIDREKNTVILHEEKKENDKDLVSKAAVDTILNGGNTYFVDREQLPENVEDAEIAAVFCW
ncbi:baeRF7 domain-containing protein [Catalinimonas niigatensis]|uniref:baeRF7 domain-containing protein n=1 Tax=Catalinimonas niigatensis TaxID=1397264 RepID=UPI0026664D60|nr:hypothetical protein [Catalinimonas niigatensis]WPP50889.1 hypothetical protein PZB72_00585 [Catalinimonas niigatensis]